MFNLILKTLAIATFLVMTGCSDEKMSAKDAIAYQSAQLLSTAEMLFVLNKPTSSDVTKVVVHAGGAGESTPNVFDDEAKENQLDRDAMGRLKLDIDKGTITNEFGGEVRVVVKQDKFYVIYTKVPTSIDCYSFRNVLCEHS